MHQASRSLAAVEAAVASRAVLPIVARLKASEWWESGRARRLGERKGNGKVVR